MNNDFKEIFESNYTSLCNYANAMLNDQHTAKDIVQSVFIQLLENKKIEELKNPTPYLIKCVRYKCIDYSKSAKRKTEILSDSLPDVNTQEIETLKEEEVLPMLHFFIDQLPAKMREVFIMNRKQRKTYREIAEELNISQKTVENHMSSALKKLRILLKEHHYLPIALVILNNF